jgi:hypothetical protein
MKGVTGATGAGEIFRRIVYLLEKKEKLQSPSKIEPNRKTYLSITNPLEGSLYKKESLKDTDKQKIRLHFETNISYDTSYWLLDGIKISEEFINLEIGHHTVETILVKNGAILMKEKSSFVVE